MTATVQLKPGGIPGAFQAISDKSEPVVEVDRGSTRIVKMRAGALPAATYTIADKTGSIVGTTRPDTRLVRMRAGAVPAADYAIADKTPSLIDFKPVSDTYLVYMSLSNLDTILPETTDTYLPVLTFAASAVASYVSTDSYVPRLTLTASPPIVSGATPQFGTDTYRPVITESYTLLAGEFIEGSDTYVPIISESSSVVTADQVNATDTYIPVLYWGWIKTVSTDRTLTASDSYVPRLTLTGTASTVVRDVDRIVGSLKPYGVISGKWI